LCEQEEQLKCEGKLEDMVERTNKEKANLDNHLAHCLGENESPQHQIMEAKAARLVSLNCFSPIETRIMYFTSLKEEQVLCHAFTLMPEIFR
jgi:hypothetical protein